MEQANGTEKEINFWVMEKSNGDLVVMSAEKANRSWATKIKGFSTEEQAENYIHGDGSDRWG